MRPAHRRTRSRRRPFPLWPFLLVLVALAGGEAYSAGAHWRVLAAGTGAWRWLGVLAAHSRLAARTVAPPPPVGVPPAPNPPAAADFARLEADLPGLMHGYGPRSSLWFADLDSGRLITVAPEERYHPASTLKLPLVVALFEGAQAGRWSLDDDWAITADDWEDGAGNLLDTPAGTKFSLRDLARRAIVDSDNIAANALLRRVGYDRVRASMRQAGAKVASDSLRSFAVTDLGPVLVQLDKRGQKDPKTWQPLLDWLSHTTMNEWLPAGLPPGFTAYHKWGAYDGNDHEAAIVVGPGAHYVLVVYTDSTRDDAALIRAVSARVAQAYPAGRVRSFDHRE